MCWGDATHPIEYVSTSPAFIKVLNGTKRKFAAHSSIKTPQTVIENDVWLGTGVYIKAGVTIHTGAVVGMNSVVTHDIPAYEIWAGNPARKINDRFDEEIKSRLLESEWWEYDDEKLLAVAGCFNDPKKFLETISGN